MDIFDYLVLLFFVYVGLEFVTLMLALSIIDYDQIQKGNPSLLKLTIEVRKKVTKSQDLPIKKTALSSALAFLNTLRNTLSILLAVFFALLISMVFVTALDT